MGDVVKQGKNKKLIGFAAHPERINRKGRPLKGHSITDAVVAMLDAQPEVRDALVKQIMAMALNGDIAAIRTLWSYVDGMPEQKTDITSDGQPLPILGGVLTHAVSTDHSDQEVEPLNQAN